MGNAMIDAMQRFEKAVSPHLEEAAIVGQRAQL